MDKNNHHILFRDKIRITWSQLDLKLRHSFNTAHTSTTTRHNFIIHMHYYEGYTQEELAKLLGIERWDVDYRIRTARQLLKRDRNLIEVKKRLRKD